MVAIFRGLKCILSFSWNSFVASHQLFWITQGETFLGWWKLFKSDQRTAATTTKGATNMRTVVYIHRGIVSELYGKLICFDIWFPLISDLKINLVLGIVWTEVFKKEIYLGVIVLIRNACGRGKGVFIYSRKQGTTLLTKH